MPIEVALWRLGDSLTRLPVEKMEYEARLETALCQDVRIVDPGLMLIGRQVPTPHGKFIDMLAVDVDGNLVVIELKRGRTPRDVVAQVLDYASWVMDLSYSDVTALFEQNNHELPFEKAFSERFTTPPPTELNEQHSMIIVASDLDAGTERIIDYLSNLYGVPINAVFFRYFRDDDREYISRTWLIDPTTVEAQANRKPRKTKEPWNGRDWYVSFGLDDQRDWEDARRYGFVSAGGGEWYARTLRQLPVGARVFVYIPTKGYVGVGEVTKEAVPVTDFLVEADSGQQRPILEMPLHAPRMDIHVGNQEMCEWIAEVQWLRTVPVSEAVWETGMFANQNSACRLRNQFTLERLAQAFDLDEA